MTSKTELTPEDELARLENAAIAGKPVTAAELVEARERVNLGHLVAKGVAARAQASEQTKAAKRLERAKADLAALFAGHDDDCLSAYDQALNALENLVNVIERENARIADGAEILRLGGVAARNWDGSYGEGFDSKSYASMEQGGGATNLTADGTLHRRETAASWVNAAVRTVAVAHGGLPLPHGGGALANKLSGDVPQTIKDRRV